MYVISHIRSFCCLQKERYKILSVDFQDVSPGGFLYGHSVYFSSSADRLLFHKEREDGLKVRRSHPLSVHWWKTERQLSEKWKQRQWADQQQTRESRRIQTDWPPRIYDSYSWLSCAKLMHDREIMSVCSSIFPYLREYWMNIDKILYWKFLLEEDARIQL